MHSIKINDSYNISVYLLEKNNTYFLFEKKILNLNYENLFIEINYKSIDKWKEINNIKTDTVSFINCAVKINNIYELQFVRNSLQSNLVIKNYFLKSIILNQNIYTINYFGNIDIFKESLKRQRLDLYLTDNQCYIKLI